MDLTPEKRDEQCIGDYNFYAIGDGLTDSDGYIDEYVTIPASHPLSGSSVIFRLQGFYPITHVKDNLYHWSRYCFDSQSLQRVAVINQFSMNE